MRVKGHNFVLMSDGNVLVSSGELGVKISWILFMFQLYDNVSIIEHCRNQLLPIILSDSNLKKYDGFHQFVSIKLVP